MAKKVSGQADYDIRGDEDLQVILICAVRYSIGRATYMPGLVTDWIMRNCKGKLTKNTKAVMASDIDEARKQKALGMDCDVRTWLKFYAWLKGEDDAGQGEGNQGA